MSQIKNSGHNGTHIKFSNGWTASIQWNSGKYCANRNKPPETRKEFISSPDVEVACWPDGGDLTNIWGEDHSDTVYGYLSVDEIPSFLAKVSAQS